MKNNIISIDTINFMKFLTYNISFDSYGGYNDFEKRIKQIIDVISKSDADVVALQEITPSSFLILKNSPLSNTYNFNKTIFLISYGCLLLSKYPIEINKSIQFKHTGMGRTLDYISFTFQNKKYMVANVHLESEFARISKNKANKIHDLVSQIINKYDQYLTVFKEMQQYDDYNIIIMGDTNITELEKDIFAVPKNYFDVFTLFDFPAIVKNKIEFTYDYTRNNRIMGKYKSRLDRIYIKKGQDIKTKDIISYELAGCEYYEGKCPSDHFAIVIELIQ